MAPKFDLLDSNLPFSNPLFVVPSAAVILLFIYILSSIVYNVYFHPLSSFPGPKRYAATRIPYVLGIIGGDLAYRCQNLHEIYGDVVRIAPDELSYNNGGAWRDIYGHRQGHAQMPKSKIFYNKPANGVDSLIEANNADHSRFRRLISHAFSERALRDQEPVITKYVDLLITRLHEKATGGTPIDAVSWYNWTTFDIIGDLAFGESFECLQNISYHPWVSNIFNSIKAGAFMTASRQIPGAQQILKRFVPASLVRVRDEQMQMTSEKVQKRLQMGTERPDFWSSILRHNDEKGMSVPEMSSNAVLLIVAGSETTATLLSGCTYHLLKHPEYMQKLVAEIRTTFAKEDEITMSSVNGLKYLLAVLDEALRMYPPVPTGLPREVPGEGDFINDTWVPGGTQVSVNQWATYHSTTNFKNPDKFVPARWLGDPEYASDNKSALQPFSIGPRNCLGRNLAYSEMRLILTRVLWNFDLELCEESKDWSQQKMYTLWEKPALMVKLTPVRRD